MSHDARDARDASSLASVLVLGIDESTDVTGLCLIRSDERGNHAALRAAAITATAEACDPTTERIARIRETTAELRTWVRDLPDGLRPEWVAYERIFHRGGDPTEAGIQASGAYLAIPEFAGVRRIHPVEVQTAIRVKGAGQAMRASYPGVSKAKASQLRRAAIKAAAVAWARQSLGLQLDDSDDAMADAAAVAVAGWEQWRKELWASRDCAAARPLFGPGSRGPRGGRKGRVTANAAP